MAVFKPSKRIQVDPNDPNAGPSLGATAPNLIGYKTEAYPVAQAARDIITPYQVMADAIQAPLRGIASGLRGLQEYSPQEEQARNQLMADAARRVATGQAQGIPLQRFPEQVNPLRRAWEGFVGTRRETFPDVVGSEMSKPTNMPGVPEESKSTMANVVGNVGNFTADPSFYFSPFGLTKAGLQAEKIGKPLSTLAQEAEAGNRALLTLGDTPVIKGAPVLKAITQAGDAARIAPPVDWLAKGFTPRFKTSEPGYNYLAETKFLSPQNESILNANKMQMESTELAKKLKMEPDVLHKQMLDYMEPPGSQVEKPNLPAIQKLQKSLGSELNPEVKALADKYIAQKQGFVASEQAAGKNYDPRKFYQPHYYSPEFQKFTKGVFNDADKAKVALGKSATDVNLPEFKQRGLKLTTNEVNNLSSQGRLTEVDNFKNYPELNNFKGKVFDDNVSRVQAQRYLNNVRVSTTHDFVNATNRQYGVPDAVMKERFRTGQDKPKDWLWVNSKMIPGGGAYFPDEIGRSLKNVEALSKPDSKWRRGMANVKGAIATYYYGMWPSSVATNKLSNSVFRFIHGSYEPIDEIIGPTLANRMRTGKFTDKPILNSPVYGPMTDRQVVDVLRKNRGVGMGLARFEKQGVMEPTSLIGKIAGPKGAIGAPGQAAQNFVEDTDRLAAGAWALRHGYDGPGAAMHTRKVNLDYSEMGPIDEAITKDLGVPFYMFARKNLPRMLGQAIQHPGEFATYQKLKDITNKPVKGDQQYMSNWEQQSVPVYVGKNKTNGQDIYLYAGRYMAQTDINKWLASGKSLGEMIQNSPAQSLDQVLGMTNPVFKLPVELITNKSGFSHKPIENMPGERTQLFPGVYPPAKVTYAAKSFRPIAEISRLTDSKTPLGYRALNLATGLSFRQTDPQQGAIMQAVGFKKDIGTMQANVRKYAILEARARMAGRLDEAKQHQLNKEQAIKNLREMVQPENRPVFRPSQR